MHHTGRRMMIICGAGDADDAAGRCACAEVLVQREVEGSQSTLGRRVRAEETVPGIQISEPCRLSAASADGTASRRKDATPASVCGGWNGSSMAAVVS